MKKLLDEMELLEWQYNFWYDRLGGQDSIVLAYKAKIDALNEVILDFMVQERKQ